MDDILATNGPTILNAGNTLWRGLAAIVVVWTGIKIAMSGTFSMWTIIELVIGLWIPWVMLTFYSHADPRRRLHLPRHDCRRRQLAHVVFSVRHRDGHADRAGESGADPDHRPCRTRGPGRAGPTLLVSGGDVPSARSSSAAR